SRITQVVVWTAFASGIEVARCTSMKTSLFSGTGIAIAGAILLASCGGGGGGSTSTAAPPAAPSPTPTPSTVTVSIVSSVGNSAYKPNPVMANSGDTVVFRNND